jgi:hypothetical protein
MLEMKPARSLFVEIYSLLFQNSGYTIVLACAEFRKRGGVTMKNNLCTKEEDQLERILKLVHRIIAGKVILRLIEIIFG